MAVDYLDFSAPDDVKMPPFKKIKEKYSKDLQSSVLFSEFTIKSTQNKGKQRLLVQSNKILLFKCSSFSYFF